MHSVPAFLAVAAAVTLSPGPAFALALQVAVVHGRRTALATIAGNSLGVLAWGALSAAGVSALIAASQVAYDVLRFSGAAFLIWLGLQALLRARHGELIVDVDAPVGGTGHLRQPNRPARRAAAKGLINALANPKLALFFVALFPQFIAPGTAALPAALAMAAIIVGFDVLWFGSIALLVDRFRQLLRPRLLRAIDRVSGAVLVALGLRLATESR